MEIGQSIYKIRNNAKLTQEQFAEIFEVFCIITQKSFPNTQKSFPDIC